MRAALAFLTPLGGARPPGPAALNWFPVVGAGIGLALGAVWWGADQLWPVPVAAGLVVAADLALTGAVHFDGLVDSADGLFAHAQPGRRLEIMRAPETGAFALAAGASVLLLRFAALATIGPAPLLLAGLWCASRTTMVVVARSLPYVRGDGGLASAFLGSRPGRPGPLGAAGLAGAVVLASSWRLGPGIAAVAALVLASTGVALLGRRRIGGFTGDVLGACAVVGETAGLLAAAARW